MKIKLRGYDNKWAPYKIDGQRFRNSSYEICLFPKLKMGWHRTPPITKNSPAKHEFFAAICWGRWSATLVVTSYDTDPWKYEWVN